MKQYILTAIINGKEFNATENSREKANRRMYKLIDQYNLQVEDTFEKDNGHWKEYVCNNYNRFIVARHIA